MAVQSAHPVCKLRGAQLRPVSQGKKSTTPVCGVMLIKKHGKKSVFSLVFYDKRKRIAQMKQGKSLLPAEATTLHSSFLARLDRLGRREENLAQIGAAIGREFGHELLAAVRGPE